MTDVMPATQKLSRRRRAAARAMTASALVPQFTIERAVRFDPLLALRRRVKEEARAGTISDMLTAACAHALAEHPEVNASYTDDGLVHHPNVNVGVAVALEDGLVVPCIHDADQRSLAAVAAERERLTEVARTDRLTPPDVLDTTFTISNLAPFGVERFRALVNVPQAAILAVGATVTGVVETVDGPGFGTVAQLALSCDHRALDGAPAARFLDSVVRRLEQPEWILDISTSLQQGAA